MRKIIILLTILSVVLVGCSKKHAADEEQWEPTTYKKVNNLDGVAMILKERIVSSTSLIVILENSSNYPIFYGDPYSLEKKIDGKWYKVPVFVSDDHFAFTDIGYELNPSHRHELEINWDMLYEDLHKGQYRIVKEVLDFSSSRGYGTSDKYYLAAEFSIK